GEIECWCFEVMGQNLALLGNCVTCLNLRLQIKLAAPLFLSLPAFAFSYGWQAKRGCSSVVEHLLAKEDVASSSLVTRSSLRLSYCESEGWSECAVARRRRTALSVKLRLASHQFKIMFYVY